MIQELLFTSYEGRGLNNGGGGFCTVLSTQGMAINLASALEKLSGYRHPFDLHDPRSTDNPVNYRHAILTIGGTRYRVLSRIADLRHEHTGRSNKLAHHVALDIREDRLPIGGPTNVLLRSNVCRDSWDREVRLVEAISPSLLPAGDLPSGTCDVWKRVAGDAGWAGVVAEALLADGNAAFHVIYPLKTDVLALADEVFRLIPPRKRWELTFSTYYTSAIPGTDCNLRFLLDGTPEAEHLRRDYRQTKIDLCGKGLGLAPESPLVLAARTGIVQRVESPRDVPIRSRVGALPGASSEEDDIHFVERSRGGPSGRPRPHDDADDLRMGPPIARTRGGAFEDDFRSGRDPRGVDRRATSWTTIALVGVAIAFVLLSIAGAGVGGMLVAQGWATEEEKGDDGPLRPDVGERDSQVIPVPAVTDEGAPAVNDQKSGIVAPSKAVASHDAQGATDGDPDSVGDQSGEEGDRSDAPSPRDENGRPRVVMSAPEVKRQENPTHTPPTPAPEPKAGTDEGMPTQRSDDKAQSTIRVVQLHEDLPWFSENMTASSSVFEMPVTLATEIGDHLTRFELVNADSVAYKDGARTDPQLLSDEGTVHLQWKKPRFGGGERSPADTVSCRVATVTIDSGELRMAWSKEMASEFGKVEPLPVLNSLRCCLARASTEKGDYYLPLMRPLAPYSMQLVPPAARPPSAPDSDGPFILPKQDRLIFRIAHLDALPENLRSKGLHIERMDDGELQGQYSCGMAVVYRTPKEKVVFLETRVRVSQSDDLNRLALQADTTIRFDWTGSIASHPYSVSETEWGRAAVEIDLLLNKLSTEVKQLVSEKNVAPENPPPNTDPASVRTKKVVQAEIDRRLAMEEIGVLQQALIAHIKGSPIRADIAVGAKYGDDVPVVWIYGEPKRGD